MNLRLTWKAGLFALMAALSSRVAHASVAILMEEPYGQFGAFNPTGHAAVYLNHVCADSPTELRLCRPGELGVVISRYHKMNGYDWIAMPLIPYLYGVESQSEIPRFVSRSEIGQIRDSYRRAHLEQLAPDRPDGRAPHGEWTQLVGESYNRAIHGFQVETTREQDERFIALVNDRKNIGHFNLFFHNCADFSRVVLDTYFPGSVHRNLIADIGMTTPKQVAKELVRYGRSRPELQLSAFYIPQVAGDVGRSHPTHGVTESLVKSKRYIVPMVLFAPEVTGGVVLAYLVEGRGSLPENAPVFKLMDLADNPTALPADQAAPSSNGEMAP